jgi:hypothetical protein
VALPISKTDRDYQKFRDGDNAGETKVAVILEQTTPVPVTVGAVTFQEYFKQYGEQTIASMSTQTVISVVTPVNKQYRIDGINLSAENMCELRVVHQSSTMLKHRTSLTNFNASIPIGGLILEFGDTFDIEVYNPRPDPAEVNCLAYGAQNDI